VAVSGAAATSVLLAVGLAAAADAHVSVPAGGGLGSLDVQVDLRARVVVANGARVPIDAEAPAEEATADAIAFDPSDATKHVVHVRVQARGARPNDPAWEAILAGGEARPLFAGMTGYVYGDPGERWGPAVQIVPSGSTSVVFAGAVKEELGICGLEKTLLEPQALYPTLQFRTATLQRLDADRIAAAVPIVATVKGASPDPALATLLVATGTSVPDSRGAELTDGKVDTVWSERRPAMGQGEFVRMSAPHDVPISRMEIVVAPPKPDANGAAPKRFFLATPTQLFQVTMPGDAWLKPGETYEIVFPQPIEASCLALVLSDAFTRGLRHPDVSIAELRAYSEFDGPGATLDDVAKKLSSERGDAAAEVLRRAGPGALEAVERQYGGLEPRGRARAIDVAASSEPCEHAAPLLARGLCEKAGQAPRKAREKLERCRGATPVLAAQVQNDAATRACVAPVLATIAPLDALEPIADGLAATPESDRETRAVLRAALGQALRAAPAVKVAALLGDAKRSPVVRVELMRAAQGRLGDAATESEKIVADVMHGNPTMRTRYLVLDSLGELAHSNDAAARVRLSEALTHDADWPVRMHAAELSDGLPDVQPALVAAARDPEPRVREAALKSLSVSQGPGAADAAAAVLAAEGWPFVKAQAIGVLAHSPPSRSTDAALRDVLRDSSPRVRGAALIALGERRATSVGDAVRERLDDPREDPDVRRAAAEALGGLCDARYADRLTELARSLGSPGTSEEQQRVALGALIGLAALKPADLRQRLGPMLSANSPPAVRAAAQKALAARGVCR
jgi:HEAT repeat protein